MLDVSGAPEPTKLRHPRAVCSEPLRCPHAHALVGVAVLAERGFVGEAEGKALVEQGVEAEAEEHGAFARRVAFHREGFAERVGIGDLGVLRAGKVLPPFRPQVGHEQAPAHGEVVFRLQPEHRVDEPHIRLVIMQREFVAAFLRVGVEPRPGEVEAGIGGERQRTFEELIAAAERAEHLVAVALALRERLPSR